VFEITSLIAIVIALTQLVKNAGIEGRYTPFVSLAIAITLALFFTEGPLKFQLMNGILMGLSASGLYDAVKLPLVAKMKERREWTS
jgi:hypothetical protein